MLRPVYIIPLVFMLVFCEHVQAGDSRSKRGSPEFTVKLWESPIPYTLDNNFNEEEKTIIRAGIQTFIDNTCINFTEHPPGPMLLEFFKDPSRCDAQLGDHRSSYEKGTNQRVNIAGHCMAVEGVQHETMHALGFDHTNNRPDRDNYVTIDLQNMKESQRKYFDKQKKTAEWSDYGIPYEYSSILHVGEATPINAEYKFTAGGSIGMIFNDWKLINLHYKCPEKCATNIKCQNGGYLHPHKCNECVCPRFYKGTTCEVEQGDALILTPGKTEPLFWRDTAKESTSKETTYEEYPKYPRSARLIKAPEGTRIKITIVSANDDWQGSGFSCDNCVFKAIEIVDGDLTRTGKRFCCRKTLPYEFISETNIIGYHAFAKPGSKFVVNATFTVVDASYVLPPTTTTTPQPTTTTVPAVTKPPRTLVPVPKPEPVTSDLLPGGAKRIDDAFMLNQTILTDQIQYDPSEFWRKPDTIIKAPEGTRIRVKIIDITDKQMKKIGCIETCDRKAISFKDGDQKPKKFCCNDKNGYEFVSTTNVVVYEMYTKPGLDFTASVSFTVEGAH